MSEDLTRFRRRAPRLVVVATMGEGRWLLGPANWRTDESAVGYIVDAGMGVAWENAVHSALARGYWRPAPDSTPADIDLAAVEVVEVGYVPTPPPAPGD
jgi:hypothetical protein